MKFKPDLEMTPGQGPYVLAVESLFSADDYGVHWMWLDEDGSSEEDGTLYHPLNWKNAVKAATDAIKTGAYRTRIRCVDIEIPDEE